MGLRLGAIDCDDCDDCDGDDGLDVNNDDWDECAWYAVSLLSLF